jgi:hypothetical protein
VQPEKVLERKEQRRQDGRDPGERKGEQADVRRFPDPFLVATVVGKQGRGPCQLVDDATGEDGVQEVRDQRKRGSRNPGDQAAEDPLDGLGEGKLERPSRGL